MNLKDGMGLDRLYYVLAHDPDPDPKTAVTLLGARDISNGLPNANRLSIGVADNDMADIVKAMPWCIAWAEPPTESDMTDDFLAKHNLVSYHIAYRALPSIPLLVSFSLAYTVEHVLEMLSQALETYIAEHYDPSTHNHTRDKAFITTHEFIARYDKVSTRASQHKAVTTAW